MLKYVELTSFRIHDETRIEFSDGVTILCGRFGSGKTSIVHAIATALTGRNPYVDARGSGMNEDIQSGSSGYEVKLEINGTRLKRTKTKSAHSLIVEGAPSDLRGAQAVLLSKLGFASTDPITALLDTVLFSNRSEADQKLLLLKLLGSQKVEVTAGLKRVGITEITGAEHIARLEKDIKESAIRDRNRELESLNITTMTELPSVRSASEIEAELKRLRKQSEAQRDRKLEAPRKEVGRLEQLLGERIRLQSKAIASADKSKSQLELAQQQAKLDVLSRTDSAKRELDAARRYGSEESLMECPTKGCGLNELIRDRNTKALAERNRRVAAADSALASITQEPSKPHQLAVAKAASELAANQKEYTLAEQSVRDAQSELEDARVVLDEEERQCKLDSEADGKIIANLERELAVAQVNDQAMAARESKAKRAQKLNDEIAAYRRALIDLEAIRKSIIDQGVEPFLRSLRTVMASVGLKPPKLTMEPFEFTVGGYPISHLSDGEKVVLDLALRLAAAKRLKFPVVAVDNLTLLDRESRSKLIEAGAAAGLQFIACETEQSWSGKELDGARVYRIEDGKAVELHPAAEGAA